MRKRTGRTLEWVSGILLLFLMFMTFLDVIGRYFFSSPVPGAFELTEIVLALIIFAALPGVCARDEHISVTLLDSCFPASVKRGRDIALKLIGAACLLFLIWALFKKAISLERSSEVSATLSIPFYWIAAFMMAMCFFSAGATILSMFRSDGKE